MAVPSRLVTSAVSRPAQPIKRPTTLSELMDMTPDLPALPTIALATHREAGKITATAQSVANLAGSDPALTARILRLANSAFYGNARQVSAVSEAVLLLGMQGVRNICLLAGTYPWLQGGLPAYGLAPGALLTHSMATAVASRAIAEKLGIESEPAFTVGLLHDLGKVGLAMWFKSGEGPITDWMQERRSLGFDHAQIGGELARRWNLPVPIVNAIACHHMPCHPLEDAVYLGDIVAYLIEGNEPPLPDPESLSRCDLRVADLVALAEELIPEFEQHRKLSEACA